MGKIKERYMKNYNIGIDIGSTTVKAVVMDTKDNILWKDYKRHNTKQPELIYEFLIEIEKKFPDAGFNTFITGSGGRSLAPYINAHYIQEVNAVTFAVEKLYPETGSVIELGGQDAKVIIWKVDEFGQKTTSTFMNDKCAGGTGATIDKIFSKIGLSIMGESEISIKDKTIHHIAAKCGVFAETDVVGLVKAGVDNEEVVASLCTAVVKQNLEVLVRGNVLKESVLLLGGPNTYYKALVECWRKYIPETWKIHKWTPQSKSIEELIFVPPDSLYFAAIGAVLFDKKSRELVTYFKGNNETIDNVYPGLAPLESYLHEGRINQLEAYGSIRDGLVLSEKELEEFAKQYTIPEFISPNFKSNSNINGYIGIDGGSTSSKLVLIDNNGKLIYRDYVLSKGNPIVDVRLMFGNLDKWTKEKEIYLSILGTAVTGYASSILNDAFNIDLSVVETVAHMKASNAYYGDIDIICDIGGQDIKILFMKHGRVVDFKLNTQCSAGNGYFLQGMAEQFDIPVQEYASYAFKAHKAPAFNYGCAVFMEQDKVNFQQLGWKKEEIMAGLALVLPLNIWNYVVQEFNIAKFGKRIVLQGGTQKNLAAVKAQVDFIKNKVPHAEVYVHKYADVCGAIGAALEVKESMRLSESKFIGIENAKNVEFKAFNNKETRCNFCNNHCPRTFVDINVTKEKKIRFISGYTCEKGMSDNVSDMREKQQVKNQLASEYPNLVQKASEDAFKEYDFIPYDFAVNNGHSPEKYKKLLQKRKNMVFGIPKLLNMYFYAPFYNAYFKALGIGKIIYSDYTSKKLWEDGNKWGAIDPCFPAKVAPAHIQNLLQKDEITHICFPMITHLQNILDNTLGENACVIQMGTPEVVDAAFTKIYDNFKEKNVEYYKPLVRMDKPIQAKGLLYDYFKDRLKLSEQENNWAVNQGYRAMETYLTGLREEGKKTINWLIDNNRIGILLIGHPYHHDPGLNHDILTEFQMKGYPILCIESIPVDNEFLAPLFGEDLKHFEVSDVWHRNFNRNTNLKIWAAKIASRHPNLAVIDLSSFKCGHDAPTYSYVDNILDATETPHFLFHDIDQNKPCATINIRIQTIEYFLNREVEKLKRRVFKKVRVSGLGI